MTIYEKTAGQLVATGDRSVTTYDSGLVRVDQVYICASGNAATHRATLAIGSTMPDGNDAPAIDGLYIFPSPNEIGRPEGFTEFHVSAYGRTVEGLQGVVMEQETIKTPLFSFNVWRVSGNLVVASGQGVSLDDLDIDESLFEPFGFVFNNPSFQLLSLTETTQVESGLPPTATYTINGTNYTVPFPKLKRRFFSVEYTLDGTSLEGTLSFWLVDPEIVISSSRAFGAFTELSLTTKRDNTSPEVV